MKPQHYVAILGMLCISFIAGHDIGYKTGASDERCECTHKLSDLMTHAFDVCNPTSSTDEEVVFYKSDGKWHVIVPQNNSTYEEYIWNDAGWIIPGYTGSVNQTWYNGTYEHHWNGTAWNTDGQDMVLSPLK